MKSNIFFTTLAAIIIFSCLTLDGNAGSCNIINGKAYGDCEGIKMNTQTKGILTVSSDLSETGIIESARVLPGGSLSLSGICNGDISVSKSGKLIVTGMVNGVIKNNGGSVEILGTVFHVDAKAGTTFISGTVSRVTGDGKIKYEKGAVVNGVPKL